MNYDSRITLVFFAVSVAIHGSFLAMPELPIWSAKEPPPKKELIVEIEKPEILPRIEKIAEEKKLKKSEPKKKEVEIEETVADIASKEEVVEEDVHDEAMFRYKDAIRQKIESHRRYPPSARKHKLEGNATGEFIVSSNGNAHSVKLLQSSGYAVLDEEALAMVNRASPFPPIPAKFKLSEFKMEVTIVFDLR